MIDDPVARSFLNKAIQATDVISRQIAFTHDYEEIGVQKPRWLDVHTEFKNASMMFKERDVMILPWKEGIAIYADPLLEDAFYKLIDNSLTYGALVSTIRCTYSEDKTGLSLIYEDNGVGVAEEDKQKIFERVAGEDSRLGLFLIREILSITNITIEENGEPGKGTRFVIHVPRGEYRITGAGKTTE
jgi:signal transduction histidine kinase